MLKDLVQFRMCVIAATMELPAVAAHCVLLIAVLVSRFLSAQGSEFCHVCVCGGGGGAKPHRWEAPSTLKKFAVVN